MPSKKNSRSKSKKTPAQSKVRRQSRASKRESVIELELIPEPYEGKSDVVLVDKISCNHDRGNVVLGMHDENEDIIYYILLDVISANRLADRLQRRIHQAAGRHDSHELH